MDPADGNAVHAGVGRLLPDERLDPGFGDAGSVSLGAPAGDSTLTTSGALFATTSGAVTLAAQTRGQLRG